MIKTHPSALPKSVQLSEMLIREIAAGHIADGARLPPERVMAAEHGVAVGTLRKALDTLSHKGLLERIQGSGNYVRARHVTDSVYAFFRLELIGAGGLPTAKVIDVMRLMKPAGVPSFGKAKRAHRIRRIRLLDNLPVALEEIWLDERFADQIKSKSLMESLYLFYKQDLGLVIQRVEDRVGLAPAPKWGSQEIALAPGAPAGFVERLGWGQDNTPAEYSRTWFNADLARYTARFQ